MVLIGTYWEDDPAIAKMVESKIGFQLDLCRAANWHANWQDTESDYGVKRVRDLLSPRSVQHMMVPFPKTYGKDGSKDGWTRAGKGEFNSHYLAFFKNLLAALPAGQKEVFVSTSYETNANFWYCDIAACGGEAAYRSAVTNMRAQADAAQKGTGKTIILAHNPVNENWKAAPGADWKGTFVNGAHGALLVNYYMKPQYRSNSLDKEWEFWTGAYIGLNAQIAFAKEKGVPWGIPECGFLSDDKYDIRPFVQKLGDLLVANASTMALFMPWISDKDYPGQVYAGRSPKAAEAVAGLMKRLKAAQTGTVINPTQPADTSTVEPAAPSEPQDPAMALASEGNEALFLVRDKYPEPANSVLRAMEDRTFWPLVGAGLKNGDATGHETDPTKALALAVHAAGTMDGWPAEAVTAVQGWLGRAKALLPAQEQPETEPPVPEQPAPGSDVVATLQAQIARLQEQLTAEQAARAAVEQKLAAVRVAAA